MESFKHLGLGCWYTFAITITSQNFNCYNVWKDPQNEPWCQWKTNAENCANGDQRKFPIWVKIVSELYALIACTGFIKALLSILIVIHLAICRLKMKEAFLHDSLSKYGKMWTRLLKLGRETAFCGTVFQLNKSLYGLKQVSILRLEYFKMLVYKNAFTRSKQRKFF